MKMNVIFKESKQSINPTFEEVHNISDGGFNRGYAEGYETGTKDGYEDGYAEGLAERNHETWVITYVDGTVEEKEVALL